MLSLSRSLRWLRRFPYRRGYGVHSPFAFQLITDVIYETGIYYAYDTIDSLCGALGLRRKDCRLLMRLANFWQARETLLCGADEARLVALEKCLKAGCRRSVYRKEGEEKGGKADLVVATDWVGRENDLLNLLRPKGLLVLWDVDHLEGRRAAWKRLLECNKECVVSFDLGDFGLVFLLPKLKPAHYVVNYF